MTQQVLTVDAANEAIKAGNSAKGEQILKSVLAQKADGGNEDLLREQEAALLRLGELYRDARNVQALTDVVRSSRSLMTSIAKAKTAKLIRQLIDFFSDIPEAKQAQIDVTKDNVEWAKTEKRIFLKQSLETKLIGL